MNPAVLFSTITCAVLINPLKDDVIALNPRNKVDVFDSYRDRFPGAILYYSKEKNVSKLYKKLWNPLAKQVKGLVRVAAVDCKSHEDLCKDQVDFSKSSYVIKLFPPLPMTGIIYEGPNEIQNLKKKLLSFMPKAKYHKLTTVDDAVKLFTVDAAIPKVVLYSDKKSPNTLFHGLAHTFGDRMTFGFIGSESDKDIAKKLKLTTTPTLFVKIKDVTFSNKNMQIYNGDFSFQSIQDWLMPHSETFVRGGGVDLSSNPVEDVRVTKPWLFESVPEMTRLSHRDVCMGTSDGLCAIVLTNGGNISSETFEYIEEVKKRFTKPVLHFSWLDVEVETMFGEIFGKDPAFVILNPHKRLRFIKTDLTNESINNLMEKIVSGDARFTTVRGNKLPNFVSRVGMKKERIEL